MSLLLSIIVPVYNSEKTIQCLIDSLCDASCDNIEIIMVDDGSIDNSLSVCHQLSKQDNRIIVIHKENRGVSSARNMGLSVAKGKYVYFCDSDDCVFPDVLSEGIQLLKTIDVDILFFDYIFYFLNSGRSSHSTFTLTPNQTLGREYLILSILKPLVLRESTDMASLWHKCFKRSVIIEYDIKFEENIFKGEDWRFILDFLSVAQTAYYIPKVLYEYRLDGSQEEKKYKVSIGVSALGSIKRKLDLNSRFDLGANDEQILNWYSQVIEQIIVSIKSGCEKAEIINMLNDPLVKEATNKLVATSGDRLIQLEIPRKYKLYSYFVEHGMVNTLIAFCRRLEK